MLYEVRSLVPHGLDFMVVNNFGNYSIGMKFQFAERQRRAFEQEALTIISVGAFND